MTPARANQNPIGGGWYWYSGVAYIWWMSLLRRYAFRKIWVNRFIKVQDKQISFISTCINFEAHHRTQFLNERLNLISIIVYQIKIIYIFFLHKKMDVGSN